MERTKNTRMYFAVVLTLCLSVIFGCMNVQAASRKISYSKYKKIYTAFARKLQKKKNKPLYMAIVKSDEPVLLISERLQGNSTNKGKSSYSDLYQYSKTKKKVIHVTSFSCDSPALRVKGRYIQRHNRSLAERIRVKNCKAKGNTVGGFREYEKYNVTYKKGAPIFGKSVHISRKRYKKLYDKYYKGKAIIFKRVK